jgi:hypothetical protein
VRKSLSSFVSFDWGAYEIIAKSAAKAAGSDKRRSVCRGTVLGGSAWDHIARSMCKV